MGRPVPVTSQAAHGVPEDVRWTRGGLSFATLHVVGSNDAAQVGEERARM
jgi:hypothetical protein